MVTSMKIRGLQLDKFDDGEIQIFGNLMRIPHPKYMGKPSPYVTGDVRTSIRTGEVIFRGIRKF